MKKKYDKDKHLELVAEKSRLETVVADLAVKMHDEFENDDWQGDNGPGRLIRYTAEQKRHEQHMRELTFVSSELESMEDVKPTAALRSQGTMRDIRRRWMRSGAQGLEKDERDLFLIEPTPDMIQQMPFLAVGGGEVFNPAAIVMAAGDPLRSDIDSGDDSAAGLAAPEVWAQDIVERLAYYGSVAASCHNFTTANGNDLHQNQLDTTDEEGQAIGEQSQVVPANDALAGIPPVAHDQVGPVTDIVFKSGWRHSNFMSVRLEAFDDLHFDAAGRVMREAMRRMGRGWNKEFTVGTGAAATGMTGVTEGIVQSATVVNGGAGSADDGTGGIDYDNLLDLYYGVPLAYRVMHEGGDGGFRDEHGGMLGWMMNENVEKQLRAALDSNGRPIWTPSLEIGRANQMEPGNIIGKPYSINQHMADGKTNNDLPLLFGSCGHYGVRNIGGPMFYRFFDSNTITSMSVVFIGLSRRDGRSRGPTVTAKNEAYAALQVKS